MRAIIPKIKKILLAQFSSSVKHACLGCPLLTSLNKYRFCAVQNPEQLKLSSIQVNNEKYLVNEDPKILS